MQMKLIDRRTVDKMTKEERKQYEEVLLQHLPDSSDKCENVDSNLLVSKILLRGKPRTSQNNDE